MQQVSAKRIIDLTFLVMLAPITGWLLTILAINILHGLMNYPKDIGVLLAIFASIAFAYPATAILIIPGEKIRKKLDWHPVKFYILLMTGLGLAGGTALIFSSYGVHAKYLPCFALVGACYGLAIALCLPRDKRKSVLNISPACAGDDIIPVSGIPGNDIFREK